MKTKEKIYSWVSIFLITNLTIQHGWSQQQKFSGDFDVALMSGNVEEVRQFIQRDTKYINQNPHGAMTPLVEAAQFGKYEMVELFVTNKADINAHGVWGRTALHFAADRGDAKMVEFLLKHNADVNARDENGFTPIVQARGLDVIKLLVAYGADINAHGGANTLYSQTLENPQAVGVGVLQWLLTNGVDVTVSGEEGLGQLVLFTDHTNDMEMIVPYYANSTNPMGRTLLLGALGEAMDNNRPKMVSAILSASMRIVTNSLQIAASRGDEAKVQLLLNARPNSLNNKDFLGWTSLHMAALTGQPIIAETLFSNEADPDVLDELGNTPLHWAAFLGHIKVVEVLLHHKAKTELQGDTVSSTHGVGVGNSPLDFAIQQGFTSIATILISNGANLKANKWYGETPLHKAAGLGNAKVIKALLAYGANVNALEIERSAKTSPLDIAVSGDSPESVRLLLANGTNLQTQKAGSGTLFHLWAGKGNPAIADQLLAAGLDVNAKNEDGQTPLYIAVNKLNFNKVPALWLLNHKADVNAKDKNDQTPLHFIACGGNTNAIQCLLDYKADVNATDKNGKTPLALLEDFKVKEYQSRHRMAMINFKAVENLLLEHGSKDPILSPKPNIGLRY